MEAYADDPSTLEVAWSTYNVPSKPELHETLFPKKRQDLDSKILKYYPGAVAHPWNSNAQEAWAKGLP